MQESLTESEPVTQQPSKSVVSTVAPLDNITGVPQGLEYLTLVNHLIFLRDAKLMEAAVSWDCKNRFRIVNTAGQQVYCAFEEFDACRRTCCGTSRGFIIHVTDNFHKEVLTLERVFKLCRRCCWCAGRGGRCEHPVYVRDGRGEVLGELHMRRSCCAPHYGIYDAEGTKLYDTGPKWQAQGHCCDADRIFPIHKVQTERAPCPWGRRKEPAVATISKVFGGFNDEDWAKDPNSFGINFQLQLEAKHKALMVALTFLIHFDWFELNQHQKGRL